MHYFVHSPGTSNSTFSGFSNLDAGVVPSILIASCLATDDDHDRPHDSAIKRNLSAPKCYVCLCEIVHGAFQRSTSSRKGFPSLIPILQVSSIDLSRREVLVELTADIDGLGFARDRVLVTPGRARNQLIPGGVARFVPWKRPSDKEPRIAEVIHSSQT